MRQFEITLHCHVCVITRMVVVNLPDFLKKIHIGCDVCRTSDYTNIQADSKGERLNSFSMSSSTGFWYEAKRV